MGGSRLRGYGVMSRGATRLGIGIVPAVLLKVLGGAGSFSDEEEMVLEAIRRSSNTLSDASVAEIAAHVAGHSNEQLAGFRNNVKGIYHELRYVGQENADGDAFEAELYELTNHPGADVRLVNRDTGETTNIQLKATDSAAHVAAHRDRYPEIEVIATEETAARVDGIESSGLNNADLEADVSAAMELLGGEEGQVFEAAGASGLLSAAMNARAALQGERSTVGAVRRVLEDVGIGAGSAALLEILLG